MKSAELNKKIKADVLHYMKDIKHRFMKMMKEKKLKTEVQASETTGFMFYSEVLLSFGVKLSNCF